ncbi:TonB-dependent receptor domain-containing protein [Hymenobacter cheonanensis]|uniref:TonB-dependent receptor domain-containing protein n=1 Tax=Hymenobacter sp. CA2-7 TaxID=3063993 RepID=UPI0027134017|nr:TonB-dependent receptor [Hymenobacter sp. CA2-7]MDO7886523.1 TonB-dependent receptor [Hymenobacter sp. CA2-7]
MKTTIQWLVCLFFTASLAPTAALAQAPAAAPAVPATGALTGTVLDSLGRQPVAYATVVLLPPTGDKPLTGVAADDQGHFALTKLAAGSFRLRASYVGYGTRTRPVVVGTGPTAVGTLLLPTAAQALGEAVVIGTKPVVEVKPDRLVYNADQDVSNAGGTAQDVLRKAPLLAVDGDGNVKMRGSANFKVLVNNKPSPTLARNLAEALKSIPAEQIKSVEIITTPSAKYDGEGTAGIINIVLKKGVDQGLNGRVGLASGNRNTNFNSALNFKKGKIGFTSSANAGAWYNPGQSSRERIGYAAAVPDTLRQSSSNHNLGGWYYGTVGLDYDPAEHHSISLAGSVNGYGGNSTQDLVNQYINVNPANNQLFTRATKSVFSGLNVEGTGTYTRTFATARKEWSVLGQYALNSGTFGYDFDQYANSYTALEQSLASYRERSRGRTPGHEVTLQTDFTQPFGDKRTLELGLKAIFRRTGSQATVDTLRTMYGPSLTPDGRRVTDFTYAQNVQAAYAIYSFSAGKKLTGSLGTRIERTEVLARFGAGSAEVSLPSYLSLLPNGSARYAFSDATSLRFAYSRRITRPYIDYLNPFVDRSDAKNISFGNSLLSPEFTDSYELAYSTTVKTTTLNAALSVRHTGNAIEQIRYLTTNPNPPVPLPASVTPDPSVAAQTFANVAANTFYQFNVYLSAKPLPKWDLSAGPDVQYVVRSSPALGIERRGFAAGINVNTSYKLNKGFTVQGFAFASTPMPDIQGTGPANLYYQLGVKKTLLGEKADLTLNFGSPFNAYWAYRNTTTTPLFTEHSEYRAYQRSFRLNFSYRFGQAGAGKQRKSIQNDDTKSGSSKQGG